MDLIEFNKVSVHFPIFNANTRSLRKKLIEVATGGKLTPDHTGHMVVQALTNITFRIGEGERVGLLGHNGAGKTTLLGALNRVYAPTSGTARITGSIGSLINITVGTDAESTGRENILLRGAMLGIPKGELLTRMDELIDFSELGNFIDMPVRTYSSGMSLRLAFAVATMVRPDILLMDEWLSVGDKDFRVKAQKRLEDMLETTKVLVIASHSRDLILRHCQRVIWLEHGQIKMDGPTGDIVPRYFGK